MKKKIVIEFDAGEDFEQSDMNELENRIYDVTCEFGNEVHVREEEKTV